MSLDNANIFHAKRLLRSFRAKKSAFVDNVRNFVQILCLVSEANEILVHYVHYGEPNNNKSKDRVPSKKPFNDDAKTSFIGDDKCGDTRSTEGDSITSNWKLIVWFQKSHKQIQDLCFDPNGSQLLVVCYDNTLHVVPILWIINPEFGLKTTTSQEIENFYWPFRSDEITSFIVPFSGPHECTNSKTCPNNADESTASSNENDDSANDKYTPAHINEMVLSNSLYNTFYMNDGRNDESGLENSEAQNESGNLIDATIIDDRSEQKSQSACPYPLSVVWWVTAKCDDQNHQHRALIGYSDGSICVVGLTPNCPFIANTAIESSSGGIEKMIICHDPIVKSVSLLINSTKREQWKLLLEQNSIGYTFPDDIRYCLTDNQIHQPYGETTTTEDRVAEDDWQIIIPMPSSNDTADNQSTNEAEDINNREEFIHLTTDKYMEASPSAMCIPSAQGSSGIFPAARARLASLRDLGAKKIGALKLKLIDNKIKSNERDRHRQHMAPLACMHVPSFSPEILTTPAGPYFIVQSTKDSHLLSALHPYSDTLSVHSMDISLVPLHIYKIPKKCTDILITPHIIFTKQTVVQKKSEVAQESTLEAESNCNNQETCDAAQKNTNVSAVGVIGCKMTALKIGEDSEFNELAMLSLFPFPDEEIIDIHRASFRSSMNHYETAQGEDNNYDYEQNANTVDTSSQPKITAQTYRSYRMNRQKQYGHSTQFGLEDRRVIEHEFPNIEWDKCIVVTNQSLYSIEFRDHPHIVFLNLVRDGEWKACEQFCKIFDLDFSRCIEYAGDVLLKKKKTTQALLTYNIAKIPPVKTALKLAMFGQNSALMQLCALALKIAYILRSTVPKNHTIKYLMGSTAMDVKKPRHSKADLNCGVLCSDFSYERDETPGDLQMSNPSQFHLSNLLLLTLAENAIRDKQYMPLWNFLITNKRYHTNMGSIVLSQSGLYQSTVILALNRGAHMDAFCALVGVTNQEFGYYSEINEILHNLSDPIFMECIIYLPHVAIDYFNCIQTKIEKISEPVLIRLRRQLDPFAAVFRPVVSQLSTNFVESGATDVHKKSVEFCRHFIETFLVICFRLYTLKCLRDDVCNGLNMIHVSHEENQFAIRVENHATLSAGFSHCAAVVDGSCYMWGSNGIACTLSSTQLPAGTSEATPKCVECISCMGLEVHAVKCGKSHSLILTNNGVYVLGNNTYGQLGIGKHQQATLQPMLLPEFDGKNISLIEAGQYHNAVYADCIRGRGGGRLYTWGWGIYGQLGHENIFTQYRPKVVQFFNDKEIMQISLGHAHSLVLCNDNLLYVFGCNLFGQLGQRLASAADQKTLKSSVPLLVDLTPDPITHIHTKFFANFVVTKSNKLYTWGASPQLIRLMNQARKRARMLQKSDKPKTPITNERNQQAGECVYSDLNRNLTDASAKNSEGNIDGNTLHGHEGDANINDHSNGNSHISDDNERAADTKNENKKSTENLEIRIKKILQLKASASESRNTSEPTENRANENGRPTEDADDEYIEHLYPTEVDTSNVTGEIIQVSSGLYHNALVTDQLQLYTWGKNLEKQLGKESARCDLPTPTLLELNDKISHVECGADFTVVMTDTYIVKAFGNNNYGQCGRELSTANDRSSIAGKMVRLRVSKRVVRLPDNSQCVDHPMEVPLPRPKIRMNFEAVRYLKSVPKFRRSYMSRAIFDLTSQSHIFDDDEDGNCESPYGRDHKNFEYNSVGSDSMSANSEPVEDRDQWEMSCGFIHYCLFIFHGIYDPHKVLQQTDLNEFKIRILMLNYCVKEAFSLCLSAAKATVQTKLSPIRKQRKSVDKDFCALADREKLSDCVVKLFEFFTKNASVVPIHRTDLKYLIHAIFMYFINNSMPLDPIESYFLSNIDHYLFGLAIIFFFNNNNNAVNSKLERQIQQKYAHLFNDCAVEKGAHNLHLISGTETENSCLSDDISDTSLPPQTAQIHNGNDLMMDSEEIFKNVSTSFKTIICQRLIEFDNDLN